MEKDMKPSELIKKYGWCQAAFARNHYGQVCETTDKNVASFCLMGSVIYCYRNNNKPGNTSRIYKALKTHLGIENIVEWNDNYYRKEQEVIAALEAIGE